MARIPLLCPIDGTNLGNANLNITATRLGNNVDDVAVGGHVHMLITFNLTCQNGHVWQSMPEAQITAVRTA